MPRKLFRKYLPSHESIKQSRWLAVFGRTLHHPNLWHLHRRSVAGGVAVGLFTGLFPAPFQMISAALLSGVFKVNLPVAVLTTLYTNPFTIVPIYFAAYKLGQWLTGTENYGPASMAFSLEGKNFAEWLPALWEWLQSMGRPLALGLLVMGIFLAITGYVIVDAAWRAYVIRAWRKRRETRRARSKTP